MQTVEAAKYRLPGRTFMPSGLIFPSASIALPVSRKVMDQDLLIVKIGQSGIPQYFSVTSWRLAE
jgi:hypothetical protein